MRNARTILYFSINEIEIRKNREGSSSYVGMLFAKLAIMVMKSGLGVANDNPWEFSSQAAGLATGWLNN